MRREELAELHYITPIANVASILVHGLLSNRRVAREPHVSVANPQVQGRRESREDALLMHVLIGDLFESGAQTLVNTVNCVGVMG